MPEFGLAGAETMCETLCYQLQASGKYNVVVVSLFDFHSSITDRMEDRGIKILYLGKNKDWIFPSYKVISCDEGLSY